MDSVWREEGIGYGIGGRAGAHQAHATEGTFQIAEGEVGDDQLWRIFHTKLVQSMAHRPHAAQDGSECSTTQIHKLS